MPVVVLLDRDVEFREHLREALEGEGFSVTTTSLVDCALTKCLCGSVDVVVADVGTLAAQVDDLMRTVADCGRLRVVLIAELDAPYVSILRLFPFLKKPFDPSLLVLEIRKALYGGSQQKASVSPKPN